MRKFVVPALAALALALPPLTCHIAPRLVEHVSEPPELKASKAAVVRQARAALARLRAKYGTAAPDDSWSDLDREIYRNHAAALVREGEEP